MADEEKNLPLILVAEDEVLLAMDLCDMLREAGCEVIGPARTLAAAEALATGSKRIDLAMLDLNLAGDTSLELATWLARRGVPVVLTTGYDEAGLPPDLPVDRVCIKPLSGPVIRRALSELLQIGKTD